MSSGDTSRTPSAYDPSHEWKRGLYQADVRPSFLAISPVSLQPTSCTICAYTVLIEWTMAFFMVELQPPPPSALWIRQSSFGVGVQPFVRNAAGAEYTLPG